MKENLTLHEITEQESGIVIYPGENKDKVIVCNWSCGSLINGGMPFVSPFGEIMCWPMDEILEVTSTEHVPDIRAILPGTIEFCDEELETKNMDVVYDRNEDLPALWGYDCGRGAYIDRDDEGNLVPTSGKVYRVKTTENEEAIVIAPDGWC